MKYKNNWKDMIRNILSDINQITLLSYIYLIMAVNVQIHLAAVLFYIYSSGKPMNISLVQFSFFLKCENKLYCLMYHEGILKKKKPLYVRNERVSIAFDSSRGTRGHYIHYTIYNIYIYMQAQNSYKYNYVLYSIQPVVYEYKN